MNDTEAGQVPAEAVEAFYAAYGPAMEAKYNEDGSAASSVWHNAGVIAGLAAAAPLIVVDRDETIRRLRAAMKALDDGLAQHGEHIARLTAERIALADKIEAAAEASFEDSQWIGGMYQAASMVRTPGGPR